jgi:hypothetical protein
MIYHGDIIKPANRSEKKGARYTVKVAVGVQASSPFAEVSKQIDAAAQLCLRGDQTYFLVRQGKKWKQLMALTKQTLLMSRC